MLFTVYPADNNRLEETAPKQGHSTSSVVVEQLENVDTTLHTSTCMIVNNNYVGLL